VNADRLHRLVVAHGTATQLGHVDPGFHRKLEARVQARSVRDYFLFDPRIEPPPRAVRLCEYCGSTCGAGRRTCIRCGEATIRIGLHEIWLDAVITAFFGEFAKLRTGASLKTVLRWLPFVRRVLRSDPRASIANSDAVLGITHLLYALTEYNVRELPTGDFGFERRFLVSALPKACSEVDLEVASEIVEALRILDEPLDQPVVRAAIEQITLGQNGDGSWGPTTANWYTRYHTTWTCLDALRPYAATEPRRDVSKSDPRLDRMTLRPRRLVLA
jgi:hypothetical protein